jgi:hypothetical protein
MDEWEDYPIKVLIMAPLIMVSLPTVSSFFSTRGCFLRGGWSPSGDPPPLSSLWMAFWCEWLSPPSNGGAQAFRVQDPSGARKTGPNRPPEWAGSAGRPGPTSAQFGRSVGPYAFMYFVPSTCMILTMLSSRPMKVLFAWSSIFYASILGGVPRSTSVLATFGSDFIKLMNTNKTPKILLWTCCESVLYVHVFLHKHNTSKCMHKDELIWLVCLVAG